MPPNFFSSPTRNDAPLFWIGSRSVRLVPLLVGLYSVSMIAVVLLLALGRSDLVQGLVYSSNAIGHGQVWRLVTYPFVNPPTFWFALEMMMLYYFGRVVELGIGSRIFALFYVGLILFNAGILQIAGIAGLSGDNSGVQIVNVAIFAAFVTMHPGAPFFFGLAGRWMLLALLALSSLQLLADHQWVSLLQLIAVSASAIIFTKWRGFREPLFVVPTSLLPSLTPPHLPHPEPTAISPNDDQDHHFTASTLVASCIPRTVAPTLPPPHRSNNMEPAKNKQLPIVNIDQLLEKISQTGMISLTEHEKEELNKASVALLERDQTS